MRPNLEIDEALADARARFVAKRPKSREAYDAARRYMPGGNTRTVLYHDPFPLCIAEGEAAHITDVACFRYLNMLGEYTAGVFGHSHPATRRAVAQAMQKGVNLRALPGDRACALHQFRRRSQSDGDLDRPLFHRTEPDPGFRRRGRHDQRPFSYVLGAYNDIDATRAPIRGNANDLACVPVEPMLGSGVGSLMNLHGVAGPVSRLADLRNSDDRAKELLFLDLLDRGIYVALSTAVTGMPSSPR